MIKIGFSKVNGLRVANRPLTEEEADTVTSVISNGETMEIIYYQGDEPVVADQIQQVNQSTLVDQIMNASEEEKQRIAEIFKPLIINT